MWKLAAYSFVAVAAIAIGPFMTYRLQNQTNIDSQAILLDHHSIGEDHRQLTDKISDLSGEVSEMQRKLQRLQNKLDGLAGNIGSARESQDAKSAESVGSGD